MSHTKLLRLQEKANEIRVDLITSLINAGSGHSAGSLGMADVITALYFGDLISYNSNNPTWEERDYVVLSNGHICPLLYTVLAHAGFFPKENLNTLRRFGSPLQGHPHRSALPGLETSSGPLGMGLSQAAGMAYGLLHDGKKNEVYALLSDGEHNEGNTWEAMLFAGKYKLLNLTAFIDRNYIQIDGYTEEIMPLEPLKEKYEAFNWFVIEIDGHNMQEIIDAVHKSKAVYDRPVAVICYTIPGKGIEFMESDFEWHGKSPGSEGNIGEAVQALHELRTLGGSIKAEYE